MAKYQTATGMRDLFKEDFDFLNKANKIAEKIADFYGFDKIETPVLEYSEIFEKGTGMFTDIVEKEMYSLRTKGGDRLTLRPEITPGVVRAYIQNGMQALPKPVNLWYFSSCFRHERPQLGRYRQFNQIGFESYGISDPIVDAITIQIFYDILQSLGIKDLLIEVNCIGCVDCRANFRKALLGYLKSKQSSLCVTCKKRMKKNPLRILDCKEEKCERVRKSAPQILDYLCKDCHDHFKGLLEFLDELGLPYNLNSCLVRGLDYYTKTVFEIFQNTQEGKSQGALAGGGRYDNLVKLLGGKETPACGGALGVDRVANLLKDKNSVHVKKRKVDIFLAQVGELSKRKGLKLFKEFFGSSVKVATALHKDSLTSQLKLADRLGAKYSLILGQKESLDGNIIVREMKTGKQRIVALDKIVGEMKKKV